ncbi:hypothetical protein [Nostoc sp. MG11]|nr:hypothetical protein [Nostoc sp. MG11]
MLAWIRQSYGYENVAYPFNKCDRRESPEENRILRHFPKITT